MERITCSLQYLRGNENSLLKYIVVNVRKTKSTTRFVIILFVFHECYVAFPVSPEFRKATNCRIRIQFTPILPRLRFQNSIRSARSDKGEQSNLERH